MSEEGLLALPTRQHVREACLECVLGLLCVCLCVLCMMWNQALGTSSPGWLQAYVLDYWYSAGEQMTEFCSRGYEENLSV